MKRSGAFCICIVCLMCGNSVYLAKVVYATYVPYGHAVARLAEAYPKAELELTFLIQQ